MNWIPKEWAFEIFRKLKPEEPQTPEDEIWYETGSYCEQCKLISKESRVCGECGEDNRDAVIQITAKPVSYTTIHGGSTYWWKDYTCKFVRFLDYPETSKPRPRRKKK